MALQLKVLVLSPEILHLWRSFTLFLLWRNDHTVQQLSVDSGMIHDSVVTCAEL